MKFNGKRINQKDFCDYMNNLTNQDNDIDLSYFNDEFVLPQLEGTARNKCYSKYVCYVREYEGILTFRYFTRTIRYSNGKRRGLTIHYDFTREFERLFKFEDKDYLCTNGINSFMTGWNINVKPSEWVQKQITRPYYSYYGGGRRFDIVCDTIDVKSEQLKVLENAKKDIFEATANCIENCITHIVKDTKLELAFKCGWVVKDSEYLKDFSNKQIAFACNNNLYYHLPLIKYFETYEVETLNKIFTKVGRYSHWKEYDIDINDMRTICRRLNIDKFKLLAFIRKVDEFDANTMIDLLNMLDILNYDLKRALTKNYKVLHDELSIPAEMERERKHKENEKKMLKEFTRAMQCLNWINRVGEYTVIVPQTIEDYKNEGKTQNICVYSNAYYKKVYEHKSIILFVRENDKADKPYVCVELNWNTFSVLQCRGKANSKPKQDVIDYVNKLSVQLYQEAQAMAWA